MKKPALISFLVFIVAFSLSYGQANDLTVHFVSGNSRPGLINITEINVGIGLNIINVDYSLQQFNLSSILGIGLAKNLTGGIGIGYSFYNGNIKPLPLFVDFRYFTNIRGKTFFIFGDCGIPLNPSKTEDLPKMFVNPGVGMVLPVSKKLSVSFGAGLFTQFWFASRHDSFIIIKNGMIYSFNNKKN